MGLNISDIVANAISSFEIAKLHKIPHAKLDVIYSRLIITLLKFIYAGEAE